MNILRRTKKNSFANINISSITDNKKFWKTAKSLFEGKISHKDEETNHLVENNTVANDDLVFADTFNKYSLNIVQNVLTLTKNDFHKNEAKICKLDLLDPIEAAVSKYMNHSSLNATVGNMPKLENSIFRSQIKRTRIVRSLESFSS